MRKYFILSFILLINLFMYHEHHITETEIIINENNIEFDIKISIHDLRSYCKKNKININVNKNTLDQISIVNINNILHNNLIINDSNNFIFNNYKINDDDLKLTYSLNIIANNKLKIENKIFFDIFYNQLNLITIINKKTNTIILTNEKNKDEISF